MLLIGEGGRKRRKKKQRRWGLQARKLIVLSPRYILLPARRVLKPRPNKGEKIIRGDLKSQE